MTIEELIYRITGNVVVASDSMSLDSSVGSTYNFEGSFPAMPITFKVAKNAKRVTYNQAYKKIVYMVLSDDKALSSVVAEDIVELFRKVLEVDPSLVPVNKIRNREVKVRLLAASNAPEITTDIVYNVLFFLVTGRTLYVRTFREFRRDITDKPLAEHQLTVLHFMQKNREALAKYYRRNRSLLLFVKKTFYQDKDNFFIGQEAKRLINKISKESRSVNEPTSNKTFSKEPINEKPTDELLRMLYASDVITVRNGTHYKVEGRSKELYPRKEILSILRTRDDVYTEEQLLLEKDGWKLALPSSAKKAAGIVPNGSSIEIKSGQSFGVRWSSTLDEDGYVDLDLSFTTADTRYGWNSKRFGEVSYSGDMTSMQQVGPNLQSASEVFTVVEEGFYGVLDVSAYHFGSKNTKVELLIGDIALPIEHPTGTTILGYVMNGRFYVNVDSSKDVIDNIYNQTVTSTETFNNLFFSKVYSL